MNVVKIDNKNHYVRASETFKHISHIVDDMMGFGFTGKDIDIHSIHSSLAMALYLAKRPVSTIMLLGRWCSDAFLLYTRQQVQEVSSGISADMVSQMSFFTIPDLEEHDLDPHTRNSQSFANTISLNGPNAVTSHAQRPAMHVWH